MRAEADIRQELEEVAQVTEAEWTALVEDRYVSEVELDATPFDDLVAELRRRRRGKGQPANGPRPQRGLTEAHQAAKSVLRERDAAEQGDVEAARQRYLDGELIPWGKVCSWIEDQAEGGEQGEYPAIAYAGPDDRWVRWARSTSGLEPLRRLSEQLAKRYDWQPAQATAFVLAGVTPVVPSIRSTVRRRFPHGTRIVLEIDPEQDPGAVTREYARIRQQEFGRRRRIGERKARLAEFAAEHPELSWDELRRAWRDRHPDWSYRDRGNFQRDVTDALDRLGYQRHAA